VSRAWIPRVCLGLLVVVVGYAIVSLSVGEGGPGTFDTQGVEETQQLLGGLRQDGARLGDPDAPIELALYTDLRFKNCARFQEDVVNPVIEKYVRTNQAQIDLHHFDLGSTEITQAALAAIAAGQQGRQWQFANLVLANLDEAAKTPGNADEKFLRQIAEATPEMEIPPWQDAFDEALADADSGDSASTDDVTQIADADAKLALDLKLPAQPAIAVTGPNGSETLENTPSLDDVEAAIARVSGDSG
jgi:protein-disulfide isomerase